MDDPLADIVHTATGEESCGRGDGRMVAVTLIDPEVSSAAAKLSAELGPGWLVIPQVGGVRAVERVESGRGREYWARTTGKLRGIMRCLGHLDAGDSAADPVWEAAG